jgi:pimeloyl-ACP methyl ester carboxylesterase
MIGLVTLSILGIFINHRIQLNQEDKTYTPPGEFVEVNNQHIHVYAEGQGDQTLVFLSGHGTSYPTLDFKPLWINFTEDHRIVVVERPGYGYSDLTKEPRDIQTMLEETRTALNEAGESGPYVVFAHSMSGIEAL